MNHERPHHHHRNRAENRLTQGLIGEELIDVSAKRSAEHFRNRRFFNARIEHVGESGAGREGEGNGHVNRGIEPLLFGLTQVSQNHGHE